MPSWAASASSPTAAALGTGTPPPGKGGRAAGAECRARAAPPYDQVLSSASVQLPYKAPVIPAASLTARLPAAASDEEGDGSFGKYGKNAYV